MLISSLKDKEMVLAANLKKLLTVCALILSTILTRFRLNTFQILSLNISFNSYNFGFFFYGNFSFLFKFFVILINFSILHALFILF